MYTAVVDRLNLLPSGDKWQPAQLTKSDCHLVNYNLDLQQCLLSAETILYHL